MLLVVILAYLKQESVYLVTVKTTALLVTPELGLVLVGIPTTPTHVEMKQCSGVIMVTIISRPWGTSWCSDISPENNKEENFAC